jgi:glyoxylase-like metal-dependent hydrolase (beta-lactamase superfamily II)
VDVQVHAVASGVWHARTQYVGWVLIADGSDLTLIDTGYPGDRDAVVRSLERIKHKPTDVTTVLLTHAHPDQLGSAEHFRMVHGARVLVHPAEAEHAAGARIEQASKGAVLKRAWRPSAASWARHVKKLDAEHVERLTTVDTFYPHGGPLDVPGHPVAVHTPGHTSGHCAFHLLERGVLMAGDAVMTEHALVKKSGLQLMPDVLNTDSARARDSLKQLVWLEANVVVPSHGPAFRGSPAKAVDMALEHA